MSAEAADTTVNESDVLHLVGVGALPPASSAPNPACPICHGTNVEVIRTTPTATATRACPRCFPTP
jgi:hypothetical protein